MVEVDVHTLELKVGGTIVPRKMSGTQSTLLKSITSNLLSITIETVLARDGLPISPLVFWCQLIPDAKSFVRTLHVPESGTNLVTL
jgi:hypothetical protein